jgi:hypothetical protein
MSNQCGIFLLLFAKTKRTYLESQIVSINMDVHLYRVHIWVGPVVEFAELDALYLQ